ncbi:hypothetical protein [Flavobacterium sp.]|uniref:hypothetical protein n=1 Tax=Flavobacterium sp. TaxID=239 RepID=UPI002FD9625C
MKSPIFTFFLIALCSCTTNEKELPKVEPDLVTIQLISESNQVYLGRSSTLLVLALTDRNVSTRNVTIRITQSDISPKGALILSSGGFGNSFYGIGFQTNTTLDFALSNGLQVFEIKWEGPYGWGTANEGIGYTLALRGYTEIVKWLKINRVQNTDKIICHGGSGGSMQIAYGLTNFDLDEFIDYGILVAGPPSSDLERAIFGEQEDIALWPDGIGGFGITDYIMGWRNNGNYCTNRAVNPPSFVLDRLRDESLVQDKPENKYNYSLMHLYFVNTDDITHADQQGLLYFNSITSAKSWIYLPNETSHDVAGIEAGALAIRSLLHQILN